VPLILELLRHGEAFTHSEGGDAERALTPRGEDDARGLACQLAEEDWSPDRVFASPYARAQRTARLVLVDAGSTAAIESLDELTPDRDPEEVLEALSAAGVDHGRILLVGHQPLLGRLAGYLTGISTGLSTCELVRIECPDGPEPRRCKILSRM